MDGTQRVPDRDLLVSDAERNHVIALLNKAVGHGMLTLDEFTQRTDSALQSRTRGELNSLLVDLPVQARGGWAAGAPPAPRDATPAWPGAAATGQLGPHQPAPGDVLELKATMSNLKREGYWYVPRHLIVRNHLGNVVLDFSGAHLTADQLVVELHLNMASAKVTLPPGATVNTDQLQLNMSDVKNKLRPTGQVNRHFAIIGALRGSSLKLYTAR